MTRSLGSAATPAEVADALLSSLAAAFTDAAAVVALEHADGVQVKAETEVRQARRLVQSTSTLETDRAARERGREHAADRARPGAARRLRPRADGGSKRSTASRSADPDGKAAGTIAIVSADARLEPSEWDLLASFADQAASALERAQAVRARARARRPPAAQPAARPAAERRRPRARRPLPGGRRRGRGGWRLVRRRQAPRRDHPALRRRRQRQGRRRGDGDGPPAERLPRLRPRLRLAGRDHPADARGTSAARR